MVEFVLVVAASLLVVAGVWLLAKSKTDGVTSIGLKTDGVTFQSNHVGLVLVFLSLVSLLGVLWLHSDDNGVSEVLAGDSETDHTPAGDTTGAPPPVPALDKTANSTPSRPTVPIPRAIGGASGSAQGPFGNSSSPSSPQPPSTQPPLTTTSSTISSSTTTSSTEPASSPNVDIISPAQNEQVPHETKVRGTYENRDPQQELWLVMVAKGGPRYHPQPGPVQVQADGTWNSIAYIGGGLEDVGKEFSILAVVATKEAGQQFSQYVADTDKTGRHPGIDRLPEGAKEYARVTVIRRAGST